MFPVPKKPAPKTSIKINLLPKDPFYDSVLGKGTTWALSIGRYIVIFTELIVILSFASRFTLDRQLTDLNNEIVRQVALIEAFGDLEQSVRDVQKKIETYNQIKTKQPIQDVFDTLSLISPDEIEYQELVLYPDSVQITGRTKSTQALTRFIANIQATPNFTNVVVDTISNKDSKNPGFDFRIQAGIRGAEVKQTKTDDK